MAEKWLQKNGFGEEVAVAFAGLYNYVSFIVLKLKRVIFNSPYKYNIIMTWIYMLCAPSTEQWEILEFNIHELTLCLGCRDILI